MRTIAIIPARGGSKGVPRKNIRMLAGKPLISYSIEAALKCKSIDRVLVSTEDEEIAEVSAGSGAEVIKRPVGLAQDDTPSIPVFQHVIGHLENVENYRPDVVVILQPTSPLRSVEDVESAIDKFVTEKCDSVASVCEVEHPLEWMYLLEGDRMKRFVQIENRPNRRQDAVRIFRLNGAVYVASRDLVMDKNSLHGDDARAIIMPSERSIDIDTEMDFKLAEILTGKR